MRPFVLALLLAAPAMACGCFNSATPCSAVTGNATVFVGRVLVDSGEGWGTRPARVLVEERLFNTPEEWKEVEIQTGHGTSCYYRLKEGKRYVFYPVRSGATLTVAGCSTTFGVEGNEHILDALRNQARGGGPRLVGTVLRRSSRYGSEAGVAGARVIARAGTQQYETVSDVRGRFELREVLPGRYQLEVVKSGHVPDREFSRGYDGALPLDPIQAGTVAVVSAVCVVRDLAMWPDGSISGSVRDLQGAPLAGVTVQAFGFDGRGERDSTPLRTSETDRDGRYSIRPLPAGEYVVGVNAEMYNDANEYPPTVYRRQEETAKATRLHVDESGAVGAIDLVLGPKRKPAKIRVQVLGPNGKPYAGAILILADSTGRQRRSSMQETGADGVMDLPVYVGESYVVRGVAGLQYEGASRIEVRTASEHVTVVLADKPRVQ